MTVRQYNGASYRVQEGNGEVFHVTRSRPTTEATCDCPKWKSDYRIWKKDMSQPFPRCVHGDAMRVFLNKPPIYTPHLGAALISLQAACQRLVKLEDMARSIELREKVGLPANVIAKIFGISLEDERHLYHSAVCYRSNRFMRTSLKPFIMGHERPEQTT